MKAYIDTGIFIDYLGPRGHAGMFLRTGDRRGRDNETLGEDARRCFENHVRNRNKLVTSALTLYEAEHTLFNEMRRVTKDSSIPNKRKYQIQSARVITLQILMVIDQYYIETVPYTIDSIKHALSNIDIQTLGFHSADSIHVSTAISSDVDIIVSSDDHILDLNNSIKSTSGKCIRCIDTDAQIFKLNAS